MSDTIPHGYKMTEIGVIPDDWSSIKLENAGTWKGGGTPSKSNTDYWNNGTIPWVSSGDVKVHRLSNTLYKITNTAVTESSTNLLDKGAILIVMRSGILRKYLPVAINVVPVAINQDLKAIIPNGTVLGDYLLHILLYRGDHILSTCMKTGTTVESIEYTWLKRYEIPLPPTLAEQRAIADALSEVDEQITALDDLIAKKRDLKQGTMQRLLTGEERLPGFSGAWEVKNLSEIGEALIGLTYSPNNIVEDGILVLRSSNIQNDRLTYEDNVFVDVTIPDKIITRKNDILICVRNGSRALIGKCALVDDYAVGMTFGAFMSVFRTEYARFVFYQFQSDVIKKQIEKNIGATINQITNKNLYSFEIPFPTDIDEQQAIANVLSDMDEEISALEAQRDKTVALKTGMMQELLTGKTRLI